MYSSRDLIMTVMKLERESCYKIVFVLVLFPLFLAICALAKWLLFYCLARKINPSVASLAVVAATTTTTVVGAFVEWAIIEQFCDSHSSFRSTFGSKRLVGGTVGK